MWVKESGRAGLYAEKRQVDIVKSTFEKNDTDGILFAAGVKASVEKTRLHDNRGTGMVVTVDGSSIWTKNNSVRYNRREGYEVNAYGAAGNFGIRQGLNRGERSLRRGPYCPYASGCKNFGNFVLPEWWRQ